jgi:hypothetical protein
MWSTFPLAVIATLLNHFPSNKLSLTCDPLLEKKKQRQEDLKPGIQKIARDKPKVLFSNCVIVNPPTHYVVICNSSVCNSV